MIHIFNSESIYIGRDMKQFESIRRLLEQGEIRYKYKVKSRLSQWAGRGTIRGRTGSAGVPSDQLYEYEILIHKDDVEKWKSLSRKS